MCYYRLGTKKFIHNQTHIGKTEGKAHEFPPPVQTSREQTLLGSSTTLQQASSTDKKTEDNGWRRRPVFDQRKINMMSWPCRTGAPIVSARRPIVSAVEPFFFFPAIFAIVGFFLFGCRFRCVVFAVCAARQVEDSAVGSGRVEVFTGDFNASTTRVKPLDFRFGRSWASMISFECEFCISKIRRRLK